MSVGLEAQGWLRYISSRDRILVKQCFGSVDDAAIYFLWIQLLERFKNMPLQDHCPRVHQEVELESLEMRLHDAKASLDGVVVWRVRWCEHPGNSQLIQLISYPLRFVGSGAIENECPRLLSHIFMYFLDMFYQELTIELARVCIYTH